MSNAYRSTQVPVSRSQEAIRKLLINFGVRGIQFSEDFEDRRVNVRFAKEIGKQMRTVNVTMTIPEAPKPVRKRMVSYRGGKMVYSKTQNERQEQMARATYRALHDWLKAQFVAVEFGLLSFEDVFLSHFEWVLDGQTTTVGALIKPKLEGRLLTAGSAPESDVIEGEFS